MTEQVEQQADAGDWVEVGAEVEQVEEVQEQQEAEPEQQDEQSDDELQLTIDGEAVTPTADEDDVEVPDDAPDWAKNLRTKYKETARKAKELEKQLQHTAQPEVKASEPELKERPMPKLTDPDINFDEDLLYEKTVQWNQHNIKIEAQKAKQAAAEAEQKVEAQKTYERYGESKQQVLKVAPDYEMAEQAVVAALTVPAQNVILQLASNPAAVVLAVGRNPALLKELASLQSNPLKLAARIGELNKSVYLAPKPKPQFGADPKVKASSTKPPSAEDAKFNSAFPDATFN